jgi:hypothetical protein
MSTAHRAHLTSGPEMLTASPDAVPMAILHHIAQLKDSQHVQSDLPLD